MIVRREETATVWTVAELLKWTEGRFLQLGIASARLDAELLLAHALGKRRLELYTGYQMLVEPGERARFRELVGRRIKKEPIAYITGRREFYSLAFEVNASVLVPRPETEHVVEAALKYLHRDAGRALADAGVARSQRILDIGTGSGCIAIALAVNSPTAVVVATDASPLALEVARRNAVTHQVAERIHFLPGDLYAALPADSARFDVIASNPPYIAAADYANLMEDVRHEPQAALLDGRSPTRDGLGFYRDLARGASRHLVADGLILVEVGAGQASAVRAIFEAAGLPHCETLRDLGGLERVLAHRAPAQGAMASPG